MIPKQLRLDSEGLKGHALLVKHYPRNTGQAVKLLLVKRCSCNTGITGKLDAVCTLIPTMHFRNVT